MYGLVAQQADVVMDGQVAQQTYRQSGGVGGAIWGCKAIHSFQRVGGPLDRGRRGQGNVESCRCNWATRKSHLGVSRRS